MVATPSPDDADFDDLDAIIAESIARSQEKRNLETKQKRLSALSNKTSADAELERQSLLADIRRMEEGIVWTTISKTAVFRSQRCLNCGRTHTLFSGWMTEQVHKHCANTRRLLTGAPVESLPVRREEMWEDVDFCIDCFTKEHMNGPK